jgi:hypothetical protein
VWGKWVCGVGLVAFLALSVGDFGLTYMLIEGTGGHVYEANPVASEWLDGHGWAGLAAFKAGAVFVVGAVVVLLARRKPAVGAAVALAACLATGSVNWHSHRMLAAVEAEAEDAVVFAAGG